MKRLLSPKPDDVACGTAEHWSRRSLLRTAGFSGLAWLTPVSQILARAAENGKTRPRSLIVLWLQGGASQLETFDPHPDTVISGGSPAIATAAPGIRIADGLPQAAEIMSDLSVVRSLVSKEGDHARATYNMKTGHRPIPGLEHPSLGSIVCHELPGDGLDIPSHISILPSQAPARGGYLGARLDAFRIGDPVEPVPDTRSPVGKERQQQRLSSLELLDTTFARGRLARLDETRTLHRTNAERALRMMSSDQLAAFDVNEAPAAEREGYGDTPFGRGCLAALRLVESGVRCVEVTLNGWDTHVNNLELQRARNAILDPALAALVKGLRDREIYEETIVLVGTEFGRTPRLNALDGRDHWPHAFSVALGGGGIAGGRVIGATDPEGEENAPADPVTVDDLHATVLTALGIDPSYEFMTPLNRPVPLSEGRPVRGLLA